MRFGASLITVWLASVPLTIAGSSGGYDHGASQSYHGQYSQGTTGHPHERQYDGYPEQYYSPSGIQQPKDGNEQQQEPFIESPVESATQGPLPDGWEEYLDESSGMYYYYNTADGTTTWDRPEAAGPASSPDDGPQAGEQEGPEEEQSQEPKTISDEPPKSEVKFEYRDSRWEQENPENEPDERASWQQEQYARSERLENQWEQPKESPKKSQPQWGELQLHTDGKSDQGWQPPNQGRRVEPTNSESPMQKEIPTDRGSWGVPKRPDQPQAWGVKPGVDVSNHSEANRSPTESSKGYEPRSTGERSDMPDVPKVVSPSMGRGSTHPEPHIRKDSQSSMSKAGVQQHQDPSFDQRQQMPRNAWQQPSRTQLPPQPTLQEPQMPHYQQQGPPHQANLQRSQPPQQQHSQPSVQQPQQRSNQYGTSAGYQPYRQGYHASGNYGPPPPGSQQQPQWNPTGESTGQVLSQGLEQGSNAVKDALGKSWQSLVGFGGRTREALASAQESVVSSATAAGQSLTESSTSLWGQVRSGIGNVFEGGDKKSLQSPSPGYSLSGQHQPPPQHGYPGQPYPAGNRGPPPQGYPGNAQGGPPGRESAHRPRQFGQDSAPRYSGSGNQHMPQGGRPGQGGSQPGIPVSPRSTPAYPPIPGTGGRSEANQSQRPMQTQYQQPRARAGGSPPSGYPGPPRQGQYPPNQQYPPQREGGPSQRQRQGNPQQQRGPTEENGSDTTNPWAHPGLGFDGY